MIDTEDLLRVFAESKKKRSSKEHEMTAVEPTEKKVSVRQISFDSIG